MFGATFWIYDIYTYLWSRIVCKSESLNKGYIRYKWYLSVSLFVSVCLSVSQPICLCTIWQLAFNVLKQELRVFFFLYDYYVSGHYRRFKYNFLWDIEILDWFLAGPVLPNMGEGASLALLVHPSSDGVTIKMSYGVDVLHRPALHPIFSYWLG